MRALIRCIPLVAAGALAVLSPALGAGEPSLVLAAPPPGGVGFGQFELRAPVSSHPGAVTLVLPSLPVGTSVTGGATDFRRELVGGRPTLVALVRVAAWAHRTSKPLPTPLRVRVRGAAVTTGPVEWFSEAWSQSGPSFALLRGCDPPGAPPPVVSYLADYRAAAPGFAELVRAVRAVCDRQLDAALRRFAVQRLGAVYVTAPKPLKPGDVKASGAVTRTDRADTVLVTVQFTKTVTAFAVDFPSSRNDLTGPIPTVIACEHPNGFLHPELEGAVHCYSEQGLPAGTEVSFGVRRKNGAAVASPAGARRVMTRAWCTPPSGRPKKRSAWGWPGTKTFWARWTKPAPPPARSRST